MNLGNPSQLEILLGILGHSRGSDVPGSQNEITEVICQIQAGALNAMLSKPVNQRVHGNRHKCRRPYSRDV